VTFSQPSAGGDQFDAKDYNGRLLIVYPKSFAAETPTAHGISPSADCDIVVVDWVDPATGQPKYFQNARLFGNLAKSVSRDLGGQVLGRLGQVPTQRGNPAWVLQNFTDQDAALATPADAAYKAGQFKQPDNPMQAPAQPAAAPAQQWQGAPAAAPAAPQQQWQAPPQQAPAQQQWNPAPQAAPAAAPQAQPTAPPQQQWQAPPQQAAPASAVTPEMLQKLAQFGINPPPGTPDAQILAVYDTLPQ
jgi:hypothetical protein